METFVLAMLRRLRPREGWGLLLLALAALLCVQQAAASSSLTLPVAAVGWLGLLGLVLGRRIATERAAPRSAPSSDARPRRPRPAYVRLALAGLVWAGGMGLGALSVGGALPPFALMLRDAGALLAALRERNWALGGLRWDSLAFLGESLPRFGRELLAAPYEGQRGALLIMGLASVLLTWSGGLALGMGLRRRSALLPWALPLLAALATTLLLAGGASGWLFSGMVVLLLLVLLGNLARRQRVWRERRMDFPSDLRLDAVLWGGLVLALVLPLSAALPFALDNPLATWLWTQLNPPSGIEALERNIERNQRPRLPQSAPIAGSTLPALNLGVSLEQGSPNALALRIRVDEPFAPSPWPRYWRSRVLASYTGDGWISRAIVFPETPLTFPPGVVPPPELIVQQVQDMRPERRLIYGLPEPVGVSVPTNHEQLDNGELTARSAVGPGGSYTVYSRLPEQAQAVGQRPGPPPDTTAFRLLPTSLPSRVIDLARTLTRDSPTQLDAALAIERYLRELPYSYEVRPLRRGVDAVDQFLFDMREGYCTYYASAFAVLARSLGIPARVSIGYYTGTYDAASRSYLVYERDAHAWPELYIDGRWLPFEPTPVRPLPNRVGPVELPQDSSAPEALPEPTLLERAREYLPGTLVALALLGALLLPLAPRLLRRDTSVPAIQRELERRGARLGVRWPGGATLTEYARLLRPRVRANPRDLDVVVALLEEARYREQPLADDERRRLQEAWRDLRKGM
jgi:transglutaminase-like putative cysteine protease